MFYEVFVGVFSLLLASLFHYWLSLHRYWLSFFHYWLSLHRYWLSFFHYWLSLYRYWLSLHCYWLSFFHYWLLPPSPLASCVCSYLCLWHLL